jgi:putative endonuclease
MVLVRFIGGLLNRWRARSTTAPEPNQNAAHWLGRYGERVAGPYLRRHGYKILYRNFRAPRGGEVDIVCRDKSCNTLAFIEVKTRRSREFGAPAEAVNSAKQALITRGALAWLQMLNHPDVLFRFDILEIVETEKGPEFNLIKNAFTLPEPYIY